MAANKFGEIALSVLSLYGICMTHIYGQSCKTSNPGIRSQEFRAYDGVDMTTCQPTGQPSSSHLDCARQCTASDNCTAFRRNLSTGVCFTCGADQNLNLTFPPGNTLYLANQMIRTRDPTQNESNLKVPVKCGFSVGTVLYLNVTIQSDVGFNIDLKQGNNTNNFHLKAQYSQVIVDDGSIRIKTPSPVLFKVNETVEIHLLVRYDKFVLFVNRAYVIEVSHVHPITAIAYIYVYKDFQLGMISF